MLFRQLLSLLPEIKEMLFKAALFTLGLELLKLGPPYLMKVVVDELLSPATPMSTVLITISGVLLVSIIVIMVEDAYGTFTASNVFGLETTILRRGHDKLLSLGMRYHESHPSGDSVQLMNKGASRLAELSWFIHDQFLGVVFQILLTSIVLYYLHFWCGLVFVIFVPVVIGMIHRTGVRVQPYRQRYHGMFRKATWRMNQSLVNVRTVKDFVQEDTERRVYQRLLRNYWRLAKLRGDTERAESRVRDLVPQQKSFVTFVTHLWRILFRFSLAKSSKYP